MTQGSDASVSWGVDDILDEAAQMEIAISEEQAEALLQDCKKQLVEAMTQAGWHVIEARLAEFGKRHMRQKINI